MIYILFTIYITYHLDAALDDLIFQWICFIKSKEIMLWTKVLLKSEILYLDFL